MNREILFRGKCTDRGEWIYGVPVEVEIDSGIQMFIISCAKWESDNNSIDFLETDVQEIIPETRGQYTGLTDRNGKKIFEGDIVSLVCDGNVYIFVVIWDPDELDFKATNGKQNYGPGGYEYLPCCEEIEVIGNIHDNPELLEGENNV